MSDRIVGLGLMVLAAWYGWTAGAYQADFADPLGPSAFPQLLSPFVGALGLWLVLRPDPDPVWSAGATLVAQGASVALMLGYALALRPVGFLISTAVLASVLAVMLGARPLAAAASGLAVSVGCYALFTYGLELSLPTGTLLGGS